jgi:hypothetical protein
MVPLLHRQKIATSMTAPFIIQMQPSQAMFSGEEQVDTRTSSLQATPLISASAPVQPGMRRQILILATGGLLQTVGETLALGSAGQISIGKALFIFCTSASGVFLLWIGLWQPMGSVPGMTAFFQSRPWANHARLPPKITKGGVLALLLLAVLWSIATNGTLLLQHPLDPSIYDSDAAGFVHYQAEDVLRGINPYTDTTGFWRAVAQFPAAGATPLQRGQFAQLFFSPPDQAITTLLQADLRNPAQAAPEFDPASLHSYPAGAFLLAVPFIWAGLPSTQPLYALALLLLFGLLVWWTPQGQRMLSLLLLASLALAITLTLRSSFEVICVLCLITAWRLQAKHPVLSALLLGLACSVKQFAWLFIPFYLIWLIQRSGWRQAGTRAALVALVFFLLNSPFILAAPAAWASSMLLPITEPAFPGGIGLITLAQGNILPLFPAWVFTALEIAAYLLLLAWYSRRLSANNQSDTQFVTAGTLGLFLAPLPLLLASRSLISYTMFLPVLALAALLQQQKPWATSNQKASLQ